MLIRPRPYQQEAIDSVFDYLDTQAEGAPLVAMPTGTGKAIVIGGIIERGVQLYPHLRVQVLAHVQELVEQNHEKLLRIWPLAPAGIYSAGLSRRDTHAPITFAGIASVYERAEEFGHTNLVLIDEAHMVGTKQSGMYRRYLNDLRTINPGIRFAGLSATIFRQGMGLLTNGDLWSDVCYDITGYQAFNELVDQGFLAPLIARPTEARFDLSNVSTSNTGEYNLHELQQVMDDAAMTKRAINEIEAYGHDRERWLIFAAGVDHAIHVNTMLEERGIPTAVLHDKTHKKDRERIIRDYKAGRLRCVVNNSILTTGFDVPEIDLIGCLRPTKSAGLWVQMLGRGTRPCEGKDNCLVLDFGDNTPRLGPINDPVIPKPKGARKGTSPAVAPITICMLCKSYNHVLRKFCACCGEPLPARELSIVLTPHAGTSPLMRTDDAPKDVPQVEIFDVTRVTYTKHQREGRPASLRVEYTCGYRSFVEYVPLEYKGNARGLALKWWKGRMLAMHGDADGRPLPESVNDILPHAHMLPVPRTIRVWYNRKPKPEVLSHEF